MLLLFRITKINSCVIATIVDIHSKQSLEKYIIHNSYSSFTLTKSLCET